VDEPPGVAAEFAESEGEMTTTARGLILAELARHFGGWIDNGKPDAHCQCGHRGRLGEHHSRHVADAILAIPGIAVVELPEPDEGLGQPNYVAMPGTVFVELGPGEPIPLSPGVARLVAAALLAAADRVERDQ